MSCLREWAVYHLQERTHNFLSLYMHSPLWVIVAWITISCLQLQEHAIHYLGITTIILLSLIHFSSLIPPFSCMSTTNFANIPWSNYVSEEDLFVYLKGRIREKEREKRDLPFAASIPKWPQLPRACLGWNQALHMNLPHGSEAQACGPAFPSSLDQKQSSLDFHVGCQNW